MSWLRMLNVSLSKAEPKKEQQHLRCEQPPSKRPSDKEEIFKLRMSISNVLKVRSSVERHEAGKPGQRLVNPADWCLVGENDGSAPQIISAHELEDVQLFLGHNSRKWAPVKHQTPSA